MSDITETIAEAREQAEARGCRVIEGGEKKLLLDFDDDQSVERYMKMRSKLNELYPILSEGWWRSSSGAPHAHAVIHFTPEAAPLSADQRVALQAALGSDGFREMFAVRRLTLGVEEPSLLFQPMTTKIYASWSEMKEADPVLVMMDFEDIF